MDHKPEEITADGSLEVVHKPLAWCGPITSHFGHQVAEFSTRIAVYRRILDDDFSYCFAVPQGAGIRGIDDVPRFFLDLLEWLGVAAERVKLVKSPMMAREVICVAQQEQLGGVGPSEAYVDLLDENCERRIVKEPRRDMYYISRAGMPAHIAGEAYIEYAMKASGVSVVRPETIPLREQLRTYARARQLIFAEGSALHGIQLLGRNVAEVHVLNRRPAGTMAFPQLKPRCRTIAYYDTGELVHGLDLLGNPSPNLGITVPNARRIKEVLERVGLNKSVWSDDSYHDVAQRDITDWYRRESASPRAHVPGCMDLIRRSLESVRRRSGFVGNLA